VPGAHQVIESNVPASDLWSRRETCHTSSIQRAADGLSRELRLPLAGLTCVAAVGSASQDEFEPVHLLALAVRREELSTAVRTPRSRRSQDPVLGDSGDDSLHSRILTRSDLSAVSGKYVA
jgi:hypothetical protein